MDDRVRIEIEVDRAAHDALAGIASSREQSIGELVEEAALARIERERAWEAAVHEGLADIAAGRTIPHEEYIARAEERRRRSLASRAA